MYYFKEMPIFTTQDAGRIAFEVYGLRTEAHRLPGERDQNFYLKTDAGRAFVLKIAPSVEQRSTLDLQNKALEHLAARDPALVLPRVSVTSTGETIATVTSADGTTHLVRLLTYVPGRLFAETNPHTPEMLQSLGSMMGRLDQGLQDFTHPAAHRTLKWDLSHALWIRDYLQHIVRPERRAIVERFLTLFETQVLPMLPTLRMSVVHNDANDYNVLVGDAEPGQRQVVSVIDFGDMVHTYTVCELAIAATYAMLHKADPLAAAASVVAGYHAAFPLTESELGVLYPLICIRLCVSVVNSAYQQKVEPHNEYLTISEQPAWTLLEQLVDVHPRLAHYTFRQACQLSACPSTHAIVQWLECNADAIGRVVEPDLRVANSVIFDLSVGSHELGNLAQVADVEWFTRHLFGRMQAANTEVGIGRYNEARLIYGRPPIYRGVFLSPGNDGPEWRTVHLGLDVFMEAGSPVLAPLDGVVHSFRNNAATLDYGPTIILQHTVYAGDHRGSHPRPYGLLQVGFLSTETTETTETSVPMETMETMETSVVPQGHPVWGTGIPPYPTSLHPYGHDDLLPKNLPLRGPYGIFPPEDANKDGGRTEASSPSPPCPTPVPTLLPFFTLYGHLSADSLDGLYEGKPIAKGTPFARIGTHLVNGGWPPHLHFQIISDMLDKTGEFPGVARPSQRDVWLSLSPDPNLIVRIPTDRFPADGLSVEQIRKVRTERIGKSLSISYEKPLKIVRGWMQYLYDEDGRAYLDAVNNVSHVGHSHPRVVKAGQEQMAVLNTNTRYLHDNLVRYAERLYATLPAPLSVCFFVCSGSEANELALRLARTHTRQKDLIVLDTAYHGNTTALVEISPYKFDGPGGMGAPPYVHKVPTPDVYRGQYKGTDPQVAEKYAGHVEQTIRRIRQRQGNVAAFICESLPGCGGQIVLPEHYLKEAYRYVRNAGGVCIADEVQVGFGRVGTHFWGFETQGVVPDIVTMGKPIGNGHPLAAVVTTPEIAASFDNGMEYFNTFGGNPVSCAIGLAVLDVIAEEQLQANALLVGTHLMDNVRGLMEKHTLIGDVRGLGLYVGIELVLDRETLMPAAAQASFIANRMRERGILLSTDGPLHNVLKIKPPMVFTQADADFLVATLDEILAEDGLR